MSRPKKPTAHLELVGAFKKNPQRSREGEPVCNESVTLPPVELTDAEAQAWDFLVDCAVDGVLTKMDSAYLTLCARALSRVWHGDASITDMAKVGAMLGKLGMSPSDRSGVVVPKKDKPNPFSAYRKA